MRISIIGQAGSGKSTLAKKISKRFDIPHIQIDQFWFESGGNKLRKGEIEKRDKIRAYIKEKVEECIKQDSWVSDGWYPRVQILIAEKADKIIFLDIPLYRRLLNHVTRIFKNERNKELTKWDDIKFIYQIFRRTFIKGPKLRQFVRNHADKIVILKNYKETERYLDTLLSTH